MNPGKILCLLLIFLLPAFGFAQVKIGDTTGVINPRAVLELKDTTRGLLLPRMTAAQMIAIPTPPDGLLIYNNTSKNIFQYRQAEAKWMPLRADSSDWYLDTSTAKLYLKYGLANQDSVYYHTAKRKWLFADTRFYKSSSGVGAFNLDEGNSDKFIVKTTASKFYRDPVNLFSANLYSIWEIDNDTIGLSHPFEASYTGIASDVTVVPQATHKIGALYGYRGLVTHAGKDSTQVIWGLYNAISMRSPAHTDVAYGLQNIVSIRDSTPMIDVVYGINNTISYTSPLGTPRMGNVYGIFQGWSPAIAGKADGNAYGIYLQNVNAAAYPRSWAIWTFKGVNRFGDSTLITDGGSGRPRAVLDVNTTSSMIPPVGNTTQRPTAPFTGALRYNTDSSSIEVYRGTGWANLRQPLAAAALLDFPSIPDNSSFILNYPVSGAALGNSVVVSPSTALPSGTYIAWARVSGPGLVEFAFGNSSGVAYDPPLQNFYIKVIQ